MGWGNLKLNALQNRVIEANLQEALPNVCLAKDARVVEMIPSIEAAIRAKFQFDEGWDFAVAEEMVYGLLLWIEQNIGNCVGASHVQALADRIAHEILAMGEAEDPLGAGLLGMPFIPFTYGVGRWVGGMLGPGDGSYCGAQIDGTMKYGFLLCSTPGLEKYAGSGADGLPQGTASAGRLFGRSKAEIEKFTSAAKDFDLLDAPKCETGDDVHKCIIETKAPVQICSNWGFAFAGKDSATGLNLYKKSGSWSHSMTIRAVFGIKQRWFWRVRNQWGRQAHKDGDTFVIPAELGAQWVKQAEAIGIGAIQGLPQNPGF
jgi:hypothetical protein